MKNITNQDVKKMYEDYLICSSLKVVGDKYGIDRKKLSTIFKEHFGEYSIKKGYTEEQINTAIQEFKNGASISKSAKKSGIDRHLLSNILIDRGLKNPSKPKNKDSEVKETKERINIKNDYLKGVSIKSLSRKYSRSGNFIYATLRFYNIEIRKDLYRKYDFDQNIFSIIDSQEKAYWLGFLYADGYIDEERGKIELSLKYDDKEHLAAFSRFIDSTPAIPITVRYSMCNGKKIKACRIIISSKKMTEDLSALGCIQAKSLQLNEIPELEDDLIRHFIRGYFDGDGFVTSKKNTENGDLRTICFGFVGNYPFLKDIEETLIENGVFETSRKWRQEGNAWSFKRGGNRIGKRFYDYIYKDSSIHLARKFDLFNAVLRQSR